MVKLYKETYDSGETSVQTIPGEATVDCEAPPALNHRTHKHLKFD